LIIPQGRTFGIAAFTSTSRSVAPGEVRLLDAVAESSAKPDWNSAEDLREPFPANQSHREQLRNKPTSPLPFIFCSLPSSTLWRNIDATEPSDQRGRPIRTFVHGAANGRSESRPRDAAKRTEVKKTVSKRSFEDICHIRPVTQRLVAIAYAGQSAVAVKQRQETLDAIVEEVDLLE
jgi:hypothetical protein